MSQAGLLSDKTSPASNLETLTGDIGGPVSPDNNYNINLLTGPGLTSTGVPVSNTITWTLDNYYNLITTTTNATPDVSMAIPLGSVAGVYTFDINISAYNTTDVSGGGYSLFGTVRTNGTTATLIGLPDKIINNEPSMSTSDASLIVSGNNAVLQVTGILAKVINWRAIVFYTYVS